MITDMQFTDWLNSQTASRCLLGEFDYKDIASGTLGTVCLSTHAFVSKPSDSPGNTPYRSVMKAIPTLTQQMSDALVGRSTANMGTVTVQAGTAEYDGWVFGRDWIGRGARLYIGDVTWPKADFRSLWSGVTSNLSSAGTELSFEIRDLQHLLNQPLYKTNIEAGPRANQPGPVVLGSALNVPGILVDSTTHRYRFHDGAVGSIAAVRDNGKAAAFTADAPTGTAFLTAQPAGQVTADLVGDAGAGTPADNAADIIKWLIVTRGYYTIDQLDIDRFNALKALCTAKISLYSASGDVPVYQLVDEVCATVGAFTALTREGKFFVKRFDLTGTPVMTIGTDDIILNGLSLDRVLAPVTEVRISAKPNNAAGQFVDGGVGNATEDDVNQYQQEALAYAVAPAPGSTPSSYVKSRSAAAAAAANPSDRYLLDSLFTSVADAQAEADRRYAMWGVPRYLFTVKCKVTPLRLLLGDIVTIVHPRYQFSAGKSGAIVKIVERPSQKVVELSVIV